LHNFQEHVVSELPGGHSRAGCNGAVEIEGAINGFDAVGLKATSVVRRACKPARCSGRLCKGVCQSEVERMSKTDEYLQEQLIARQAEAALADEETRLQLNGNHRPPGETMAEQIEPATERVENSLITPAEPSAMDALSSLTEDSLGLEPMGGFIGRVDQVNGPGAKQVPEFVSTRYELLVLAKHWLKELLRINFDYYCYQQYCSRESRIRSFASCRIGRIEGILGQEAIDKVEGEVRSELAATVDHVLWNMFLTGEALPRDEHGMPIFPDERDRGPE
jgi:hypothetical protein